EVAGVTPRADAGAARQDFAVPLASRLADEEQIRRTAEQRSRPALARPHAGLGGAVVDAGTGIPALSRAQEQRRAIARIGIARHAEDGGAVAERGAYEAEAVLDVGDVGVRV